jgi:hypothetical protein
MVQLSKKYLVTGYAGGGSEDWTLTMWTSRGELRLNAVLLTTLYW